MAQIPAKGVPSVRYYGLYSNKSRGLRQRQAKTETSVMPAALPARRPRRRARWRELIRQVWGADPLRCPLCPGFLRPIEWIETPAAIRAFLEPLGLYEHATGPPPQAPPAPDGDALIEVVTGEAYPAGPRPEPRLLDLPRSKADPLYHRQWMLTREADGADDGPQPDAADDFDQIGFELPPWRTPHADPRQGTLFPDYTGQTEAPDGEPVFVLAGAQAEPEDNHIQPDTPESVEQ